MSNPILVQLERDYAIALSQYERAEEATETIVGRKALEEADRQIIARRKALKEKMERISYLIRAQVDPEWTPGHIRPHHVRKTERRGGIAKAAYKVLKAAAEPLKTREIARLVAPVLGVDPSDLKAIMRLDVAIHSTLTARHSEGEVERIEGPPVRWRVRPRKWVRPTAPDVYASVPVMRFGADPAASCASATPDASASSQRTLRRA